MKGFNVQKFEDLHNNRTEYFARKTEQIFLSAIREAIQLAKTLNIDLNKPFSFDDYPITKKRVENLLAGLSNSLRLNIMDGIESEWLLANQKNDALVKSIFEGRNVSDDLLTQYSQRNLTALAAFQNRKAGSLNLSDRVWNYTKQFKTDMELAIDLGLDGRTAQRLSQDIRSLLKEPNKLFRRVRDKRGNLQLSKAAKAYNPGQGVYRSSYKNAMRLARTEINMAYRESDYTRYNQNEFIVGYEVKRSNRKYECVVCDSLKGFYPKTFKFVGWHPQCRCYVVSLFATKQEIDKMILEDTVFESVNHVQLLPKNFTDFISERKDSILNASNLPYFVRDNIRFDALTFAKR
jgi:hypothetical protein